MYTNLPIFKQALDLNVYIEEAVRSFARFYKYEIGNELRQKEREVIYSIYKIYFLKDNIGSILKLKDNIEALKIVIYMVKN